MTRKRDGFVPIGDVVAGGELPGGLVLTHHAATPQARSHFTQLDQVTQLVGASEADADLGFMARMLALCSLPRTNLGDQLQYVRRNGPFTLYMTVSGGAKLPYGNIPRLLLAWVCTEAVRTQNRELVLGYSLSAFMRSVGVYNTGGSVRSRLQDQMRRLFNVHVQLGYEHEHGAVSVNSQIRRPDRVLVESEAARRPHAVEKQDRTWREVLRGSHSPPSAARPEHPEDYEAIFVGPRSLHVAHLPDVHAQGSAAALLAATVPPVRIEPGPGKQYEHRERLSYEVPSGVDEN